MIYEFKINRLDIRESYFLGKIQLAKEEYTVNIQTERRGKVLKLPFGIHPKNQKVLVQMTGQNGVTIEDILPYKGESEWVEIDSDLITFYAADHQDQFETLKIIDAFSEV
jgi:ribosomal protein L31